MPIILRYACDAIGDQGRESNPDVISGRCRGSSPSGGTAVELGTSAGDAAGNGTVAIVFVQSSSSEGHDRGSLSYSDAENTLVEQVAPSPALRARPSSQS